MAELRGPDFFIVGAPKSGTTSLQAWLGANPDVFMAAGEPHYFSPERQLPWRPRTWEAYVREFEAGQGARRLGEKAVWYLRSEAAVESIKEYAEDAQIIIVLRHPVEAMQSLHGYNLFYGEDDIEDFFDALAAEPDRREGRRIPAGSRQPWNLQYRDTVNYAPQVERYLSAFGEERVHVILFDDLKADREQSYREVTRFLGVSEAGPESFATANANKVPRNAVLQNLLYGARSPLLKRAAGVIPPRGRRWLQLKLVKANAQEQPTPQLEPAKRRELEQDLATEVAALASLIHRDLSAWTPGSLIGTG